MIRSSARDMARYLAELTRNAIGQRSRLFRETPLPQALVVNQDIATDEEGQALVFARRDFGGIELFGHNGGEAGSFTDLWFDPIMGSGFVLL